INPSSNEAPKKQLSVHTTRRMNVLNKVFMEHITDMMSTGEIDPEILNRNIEISHVKVTPDFKTINIYWINNSPEKSGTDELLKECTFKLRHVLSQLRVIGNVPPIQFVKCKGIGALKEVEQKLKTLDLGEDYVPSPYPNVLHHTVCASRIDHTEEVQNERSLNDSKDIFTVTLPIMRHDVFGIDHYRIMTKIKASLKKSQKAHKRQTINIQSNSISPSEQNVENVPNYLTDKEQQVLFAKFLSQKRKERKHKMEYFRTDNFVDDYEKQDDGDDYDDDDDVEINDDEDFDEYIDKEFKRLH
ncbi:Putative ribosome-binding factor A, mitochondrial, partial [Habropoda laboriosa]